MAGLNRTTFFILISLVGLMAIFIFIHCSSAPSEKQVRKYELKMQMAAELISRSTNSCLSICQAILAQWQRALISDYNSDFSDIFAPGKTSDFNKSEIGAVLLDLENPPHVCINTHQKLLQLHKIYLKACLLARNPKGSIESFRKKVDNLDRINKLAKDKFERLYLGGDNDKELIDPDILDEGGEEDNRDPRTVRIEELIRQLEENTDYYQRAQAARSLGRLGVETAVNVLIQALDDNSWQVHIAAAWALKKITGQDYQLSYEEWKQNQGFK